MPTLCVHNPVIHQDPQACYKVEVKFETLFTNVQQSRHQVMNVLTPKQRKTLLLQTEGWVHYRPSRVGPVLRLPAAKGNRKVTVMVWLEQDRPSGLLVQQMGRIKRPTEQEPSQIFTSAELARIQQLTSGSVMIPHNPATDKALHAKVTELLKETK